MEHRYSDFLLQAAERAAISGLRLIVILFYQPIENGVQQGRWWIGHPGISQSVLRLYRPEQSEGPAGILIVGSNPMAKGKQPQLAAEIYIWLRYLEISGGFFAIAQNNMT